MRDSRLGTSRRSRFARCFAVWLALGPAIAAALYVEDATDGTRTLSSVTALESEGALQARANVQYASSSDTVSPLPSSGLHVTAFVSTGLAPAFLPPLWEIPIGGDLISFLNVVIRDDLDDSLGRDLAFSDIDFASSTIQVGSGSPVSLATSSPNNELIKLDYAGKLIAGDPDSRFYLTLRFNFDFNDDGATNAQDVYAQNYKTLARTIDETASLFHTVNGAPQVDVDGIPHVVIHFNSEIACASNPVHCTTPPATPADDTRTVWIDTTTGPRKIAARNAEGLLVVELAAASPPQVPGDFLGVEVVRIRPDTPAGTSAVDIGSRALDGQGNGVSPADGREAYVREGGIIATPQLVYQHRVPSSAQLGQVWAVRDNTIPGDMEIVWLRPGAVRDRPGFADVKWPYEYRQYTSDWPTQASKSQRYVRAPEDPQDMGPPVAIPGDLHPTIQYQDPPGHATLGLSSFSTDDLGWTLLRLETGTPQGLDWVGFEVVRSVSHTDASLFDLTSTPYDIGLEVTDVYHEGPEGGFIYSGESLRYAPEVYQDTEQVFAVNTDTRPIEVWWKNLSRSNDPQTTDPATPEYPAWPEPRFQWPSKVARYQPAWPVGGAKPAGVNAKIVIARQDGSGALAPGLYGNDWLIYGQDGSKDDPALAGYNPNNEHALIAQLDTGDAVFALRDDIDADAGSPGSHVLVQYREQQASNRWRFEVFEVVREEGIYELNEWAGVARPEDPYEGVAGVLIQQPFPLSTLPLCAENVGVSGPFWEDRKGNLWARAAGDDGTTADITLRFHYPVQPGFFFPDASPPAVGSCIAWLDNASGTPADVVFTVEWPASVPTMRIGKTIIEPEAGLPAIDGQCSVDLVYQQSMENNGVASVALIDPIQTREVDLEALPGSIVTQAAGPVVLLTELSLALRLRVAYDPQRRKLQFLGQRVEPTTGFDYALLNVMTVRDRDELLALADTNTNWTAAVGSLYTAARDPVRITDSSTDPFDLLALTSGFAEGTGYVTLAMQNASSRCGENLPVSLEILRVIPELERDALSVVSPSCPFDERITLFHQGDYGGNPAAYEFEWRYQPDSNGSAPPLPVSDTDPDWTPLTTQTGAHDLTIGGPGLLTLSDNWLVARYRTEQLGLPCSTDSPLACAGVWSEWTSPQLAQGWIKRVIGDINPFDQRASGGGIEGAENDFFSFGESEVNTIVSMISQAGPRFEGSVPLNCGSVDDFGLLETYETVLNRGAALSIEALPAVNYPPANNALLLVASRIAELYVLLGNEAFADAADPTIAFGTDDGTFGAEAASIHAFQNVTGSLLEEELALLRGRNDSVSPGVQIAPFYNRLLWNFTNDATGGEVAYALNYNIVDALGNVDGALDEADARRLYPQGHGDAWGHYLSALKVYYQLLRHPNYTWNPRAEGVLVGGVPVTVDYLDERKFAQAAAAKARAGAEIVDLTYRDRYVEDPAGQYRGYPDEDPMRAWGLADWASRTGEGSYLDWIAGNAILPDVDPESCDLPGADAQTCHAGVQEIDRRQVLELDEVVGQFTDIQAQLDNADLGVNPLGLATNVVPFDISPSEIDAGKTHFEQIYDRAVNALGNAAQVFDRAVDSTQLLRRQADTLADFQQNADEREIDFKNRLIELFGLPYPEDIGPGKTYPTGYNGPDLYHYAYVDAAQILGVAATDTIEFTVNFRQLSVDPNGTLSQSTQGVNFHRSNSADRLGLIKPNGFSERRAPGEIQFARSDLLRAKAQFEKSLGEYDQLFFEILSQEKLLKARQKLNFSEINVLKEGLNRREDLNTRIKIARGAQLTFRIAGEIAKDIGDAVAEGLPKNTVVGTSSGGDVTSVARSVIKIGGIALKGIGLAAAGVAEVVELDAQTTLDELEAQNQITLETASNQFEVQQALEVLKQTLRREQSMRIELYVAQEAMNQTAGQYLATLARGQRLLEARDRFRRQTAANVQARRYKEMAFRIFRNDALQKYRAQFDLAARYVYLAAKAYDFETTLLSGDSLAGGAFLADIVSKRLLGSLAPNGAPLTGEGLADPMARMAQNFAVLGPQLGFNNPQAETNRFSMRSELFRIQSGPEGDAAWREVLERGVVPDLLTHDEFQRVARYVPGAASEPAIVIPFATTVQTGQNYFGFPLGGGDSAYDASQFSTKIRSVGVWFSNYDNLTLSNTPRVYLIPVGRDLLRSPSQPGVIREFSVVDQRLPAPFQIGGNDLDDPNWIPRLDTLTDFNAIRKYSAFRAYHDSGLFNQSEVHRSDSRAIGRSVWNTRFLLVIPAGNLLNDRGEAIRRFIEGRLVGGERDGNGISDIKIFFETYAISGN